MTKPTKTSDDKLIMAVRKALKDTEPRPLPTETMRSDYGHTGWKCPICSCYIRRYDRTFYNRRANRQETKIDYGGYNMHFSARHGTPFWREQHVIKTVKRYLK